MSESFEFLRPGYLLLIPVVVVVWWFWNKRSDPLRGWRAQMDAELMQALVSPGSAGKSRQWMVLMAWLLGVLGVAGPSWQPEPSPFAEDTAPLVVLLQADVSMDTADPAPSRMERAQQKIDDLSRVRKNRKLGLIAYAGSAHLVLPPTKDAAAVASMAREVSPGIMPVEGKRLDRAIDRAARLLKGNEGSLLVVTDIAVGGTESLEKAWKAAGSPFVQILAVVPPGASTTALDPVARALDAEVVPMSVDDRDVERIARRAARPPVARGSDGLVRKKDGGYYFLPVLAVAALLPFRKPRMKEVAS